MNRKLNEKNSTVTTAQIKSILFFCNTFKKIIIWFNTKTVYLYIAKDFTFFSYGR